MLHNYSKSVSRNHQRQCSFGERNYKSAYNGYKSSTNNNNFNSYSLRFDEKSLKDD